MFLFYFENNNNTVMHIMKWNFAHQEFIRQWNSLRSTDKINNTARIYNPISSLIITFISLEYKCKCMFRICRYFHSGHLYISFRTNSFSPILFFAARITIRATCLHFVGAPLPLSLVFCHPATRNPGFLEQVLKVFWMVFRDRYKPII